MTNSATDFKNFLDFYGGMVDKNLPVSAWDTHLILGSEKSHMLQRNQAHEPQLQSPWAATSEPTSATTKAHIPGASALQLEKPLQWGAHALQQRVASACHSWRKPVCSNEDPDSSISSLLSVFITQQSDGILGILP